MEENGPRRPDAENAAACRRREEILDAATRLFAERGFSETDTQVLADELGVGKGTLYRYFPSKRDLFLAAADRVMRRLQERVAVASQGETDPLKRVHRGVETFLEYFRSNPDYVELLMQERAQFRDRRSPPFSNIGKRAWSAGGMVIAQLIAQGRVRDMSVERITDVMAAAIYGAMFLTYSSGHCDSFAVRAEDILDIVFFGILSDPERRRRGENAGPTSPEPERGGRVKDKVEAPRQAGFP